MSNLPCQCCESPVHMSKIPSDYDMQRLVDIMFSCFFIKLPWYRIGDGLKIAICQKCIPKLIKSYNFKRMVEMSQFNLLSNNIKMEPVSEPDNLIKIETEASIEIDDSSLSENDDGRNVNDDNEINFEDDEIRKFEDDEIKKIEDDETRNIDDREKKNIDDDENKNLDKNENRNVDDDVRSGTGNDDVEPSPPTIEITPSNANEFSCVVCSKAFGSLSKLNRHKLQHVRVRCHICDKEVNKSAMYKHVRCHSDGEFYKCPECNERFLHFPLRLLHLNKVHGWDIYKYPCEKCPKKFYMKYHLRNHVMKVHEMQRNVVCEKCGYRCFSKAILQYHTPTHESSEDRKYQCDHCSKFYSRRCTLIEHLKIHFQKRAFKCHTCGKAFRQNCALKKHTRRVHDAGSSKN